MKLEFKKRKGFDLWVLFQDQKKTNYILSKENWGSSVYYLFRQGARVLRRYNTISECIEDVKVMFLDKMATEYLRVNK